MRQSEPSRLLPGWVMPVIFLAFAALFASACKTSVTVPGGSIPMPPSGGGMPSPPSPSGGGSSGGSSSPSGSSGGGMPAPPSPGGSQGGGSQSGGSQGGGSPGGSQGPSGSEGGAQGSGGEVGSFPGGGGEETEGVPPPPSAGGGGAGGEEGGEAGSTAGGGESEDESEWDDEGGSDSECGDTGAMPGGIGGMGQDGECIGGGGGGSSASASESGGGAAGGGAAGGGAAGGGVEGTGGAGSVGEFPDETAAERAERLGRELEESIGGFDEVLQEEQREIAAVGRNTEGFGEGTSGAGGGGISLGEQAAGSNNPVAVANTPGPSQRQSPMDAMSDEEIRERTPEDIPIMVDDDIIARQLREAALAEDDPALRERLWEEYRKYSGI